jgi:hypothetical protein
MVRSYGFDQPHSEGPARPRQDPRRGRAAVCGARIPRCVDARRRRRGRAPARDDDLSLRAQGTAVRGGARGDRGRAHARACRRDRPRGARARARALDPHPARARAAAAARAARQSRARGPRQPPAARAVLDPRGGDRRRADARGDRPAPRRRAQLHGRRVAHGAAHRRPRPRARHRRPLSRRCARPRTGDSGGFRCSPSFRSR